MPKIKEVSEQMRGYTIRAARVGSDEWGYITVKGENPSAPAMQPRHRAA